MSESFKSFSTSLFKTLIYSGTNGRLFSKSHTEYFWISTLWPVKSAFYLFSMCVLWMKSGRTIFFMLSFHVTFTIKKALTCLEHHSAHSDRQWLPWQKYSLALTDLWFNNVATGNVSELDMRSSIPIAHDWNGLYSREVYIFWHRDCLNEWFTESFIQLICSKHWVIQEQNTTNVCCNGFAVAMFETISVGKAKKELALLCLKCKLLNLNTIRQPCWVYFSASWK